MDYFSWMFLFVPLGICIMMAGFMIDSAINDVAVVLRRIDGKLEDIRNRLRER